MARKHWSSVGTNACSTQSALALSSVAPRMVKASMTATRTSASCYHRPSIAPQRKDGISTRSVCFELQYLSLPQRVSPHSPRDAQTLLSRVRVLHLLGCVCLQHAPAGSGIGGGH